MPWIRSACSVVRLQAARCLIPSDTEGVCHAHSHRPECQRAGAFVMSPRWEARRMDKRCDGCGATPAYRYDKGSAVLTMCGHHAQEHGAALRFAGWFAFRLVEMART